MAGELGDGEPEMAIAIAESVEVLRQCYVCGVKTPWLSQKIRGCPHFVCDIRGCLEELHCRWVDIRAELMDTPFDGQEQP